MSVSSRALKFEPKSHRTGRPFTSSLHIKMKSFPVLDEEKEKKDLEKN